MINSVSFFIQINYQIDSTMEFFIQTQPGDISSCIINCKIAGKIK